MGDEQAGGPERSGVQPSAGAPEEIPPARKGSPNTPGRNWMLVDRRLRSMATATITPATAGTAARATAARPGRSVDGVTSANSPAAAAHEATPTVATSSG